MQFTIFHRTESFYDRGVIRVMENYAGVTSDVVIDHTYDIQLLIRAKQFRVIAGMYVGTKVHAQSKTTYVWWAK